MAKKRLSLNIMCPFYHIRVQRQTWLYNGGSLWIGWSNHNNYQVFTNFMLFMFSILYNVCLKEKQNVNILHCISRAF